MKFVRSSFLGVFCLVCLPLALSAHPGKEKLTSGVDEVIAALFADGATELSAEEAKEKVRAAVDAHFSFDIIIRRAFGRNWQRFEESQQAEVVDLITETLITAYVEGFSGEAKPEISYGSVVEIGRNRIEIPSTVVANGQTFQLVYRLGRMASGWEVFDVVAEGVSMVSNYRQQFDDHFRRGTPEQLIERLRGMAAKGEVEL